MNLREIVSRLDWKAPARTRSYRTHWRVHLPAMVGAAIAAFVFYRLFPDVLWVLPVWCGVAVGQAAGILPGVVWQLASPDRVSRSSGKFIVVAIAGSALFVLVVILVLVPMMRAQESARTTFRALADQDIVAIAAHGSCVAGDIGSVEGVADVRRRVAASELYFSSHESTVARFTLSFVLADGGTVQYAARLVDRHPQDVAVRTGSTEMLIEGLRPLLQTEADSHGSACL